MTLSFLTNARLETPEEIRKALLTRIPEDQRRLFFAPTSPLALSPEEHGLDPESLQKAVERLQQAIRNKEKVLIFGDYDCDGVTATAILWETLQELGLTAQPFLPHRERHGYGLSVAALEEIWQQAQYDLVITVDNGIVAFPAFAWLKERRVDTILTDHHTPGETYPTADIVVHSTKLAGATVAWMVAAALSPDKALEKLDYAVIGTLADQVPLYGANRSFAWHGLLALQKTPRASLRALARAAGVDLALIDESGVTFRLAPRINAMGRLGSAMDALRALVSRQPKRITELMQQLNDTNDDRQTLTKEALESATRMIEAETSAPVLIAVGDWHEGVIGLIASKLTEQWHRPSIVISTANGVAKASARSIPRVNLIDFLRSVEGKVPYLALGGHAMAAGFSLAPENLSAAISTLREAAQEQFGNWQFSSQLPVVGSLNWDLLGLPTLQVLEEFRPFGSGNDEPLFLLDRVQIMETRPVGRENRHWQVRFEDRETGRKAQGIFFGATEKFSGETAEVQQIVCRLQKSTYPGKEVEIVIERLL